MKLFLILYTAGKIGGVDGPLPYGEIECERRADEMRVEFAQHEATVAWRVPCEWRTDRPALD